MQLPPFTGSTAARAASRSLKGWWRLGRLRLAHRTCDASHTPGGARVATLTKSRKLPTFAFDFDQFSRTFLGQPHQRLAVLRGGVAGGHGLHPALPGHARLVLVLSRHWAVHVLQSRRLSDSGAGALAGALAWVRACVRRRVERALKHGTLGFQP